MSIVKKTLAVFDFDETLILKDTLFDFIKSSVPVTTFYLKSALFIPSAIAFKLKRITNQQAKERLLSSFFRGMSLEKFNILCEKYAERLNNITNKEVLSQLFKHKADKHNVIIVSASIENWIRPWAKQYDIEVIGSKLLIENNRLVGKLDGINCHGKQKVVRLLEAYPNRKDYKLVAYGDGKSDQAMFDLSDQHFLI